MHYLQALPFPTDLLSLASVETCVTEKFNASNFGDLGHGIFLEFVAKQSRLKEQLGEGLLGAAPQTASTRIKVLRILSQLKPESREDEVSGHCRHT